MAQTFFARWFWRAIHSRLEGMAHVAWLIRRHLPNALTYLRNLITNAGLEAVNATIQWVRKTVRGFRNVEHFKTAIYFHCGGLDLYLHESSAKKREANSHHDRSVSRDRTVRPRHVGGR